MTLCLSPAVLRVAGTKLSDASRELAGWTLPLGPKGLAVPVLTCLPALVPTLQEKVSQLKEEVRLQYEKLHQLLDEDLRQTVEVLDKAQAKFCSENAAQALHLGERMQEAKKLLGSLQLLFDKTEDVSFMKVGAGSQVSSQTALQVSAPPTCPPNYFHMPLPLESGCMVQICLFVLLAS